MTRNNQARLGNFTSSQVYRLMGAPKPRQTYINECNMERRLQRPLANDHSAKPTTWGNLAEKKAFELLGTEYQLLSQETIVHPDINCWAGSPDGVKTKTVFDIKCPYTMKSFCEMEAIIHAGNCDLLKQEYPEYYWQLISNAVLTGCLNAELILFCPYYSELNDIKVMAEDEEIQQLHKVYWIANAFNEELPYLNDGGYYKNLNILSFTVPETDKELLTTKILEASKELIQLNN